MDRVWIVGALQTPVLKEARALVEGFFPPSYRLAGLYSTGMEAAEFALRVARGVTGRSGVLGFDGCMHGKSMATAHLGWPNELSTLPDFHRLPYVPHSSEARILGLAAEKLATKSIAAVFLEPLQGSAGGHMASREFFEELSSLCARHGSLLVVDEIFTGFHRTGEAFLHHGLGLAPDVVVIGKAMGNGFPVSGVVVQGRHAIEQRMLPGSTFAGNPLAASAVVATLSQLRRLDVRAKVAALEQIIVTELEPVTRAGIGMRGKGALWVLELPQGAIDVAMARMLEGGVMASPTACYVRLLPAATISTENLMKACRVVREACLSACESRST